MFKSSFLFQRNLLAPIKEPLPQVTMPGTGDRGFSITQDEKMLFPLPGRLLNDPAAIMQEAGEKVGGCYPVPFYVNFQPKFTKLFNVLGKEEGIL